MNVRELVGHISQETGHNQKTVESIMKCFIATVQDSVEKGESVKIQGIGTFERRLKQPRHGRNINEDVMVDVPACYAPAFKMSDTFRRQLKSIPVPENAN